MRQVSSWRIALVLSFLVLLVFSCDQFVLWDVLGDPVITEDGTEPELPEIPEPEALTIAPPAATVSANSTLIFAAFGGTPPYTFSIPSGSGTVDPNTGLYTAPAGSGTDTVRVTDSDGATSDATVTVTATGVLGISPSAVSLSTNSTLTFTATGGTGPYTFSIFSGSGSIDSGTGEYTAPSTSDSVTVRVTDSDTPPATADATVTISAPASLSLSPSSIVLDAGNDVDFEAFGGVTPYTFSIVTGGGSIDSGTGLFTAPGTADTVTVRVTDSDTPPATDDATITVNAPDPLAITPSSISLYANTGVIFDAAGGVAPYTYSVIAGVGTVNAASGLYIAPGSPGSATVRVTDSDTPPSTSDAAVSVYDLFSIAPTSKTLNVNSSFTFAATGGKTPYTFSIESGGGSINSSSGLYTAPGTPDTVTVRATDDLGNTSDSAVDVVAAQQLIINPLSKTLLVNNTFTFTALGGQEPYTYSLVPPVFGSIDSGTGEYTAPASAATDTVRVTDDLSDTSDATVTVVGFGALSIAPSAISLYTNNSVDFNASGGVTPYTFSVIAGGGSVNATSGLYTAPGSAGSATVQVTDSDTPPSTSDAVITIYDPFFINPSSKTLTINSSFTFAAIGGKTPYTFSIESGGGSINAGSGEYTAPGTPDTVTVRATDDLGNISEATVSVTPAQPLLIDPTSKTLLANDTFTFSASGGQSPYTFSLLPPAYGSIDSGTGEYTAPGTAVTDTVRVIDALSATSDATVTVTGIGPLTINPATATVPVNGVQAFTANGGLPPYTFSVASGGGSINAASGLYTAPASTGGVTIRVTDLLSFTDDASVTVSGSGCGQTYSESEPPDGSNDDHSPPWADTDDFGITLVPGCSTTITGTTDVSKNADVFKFNTGSATFVTFIASWSSGDDEIDIKVYEDDGTKVTESKVNEIDYESHTWVVESASTDHYIELEIKGSGGVNYALIISGS